MAASITLNKNNYTIEIQNKMKSLAFQFANLPKGRIAKIFTIIFQPINFYNLYNLYNIRRYNDIYHDQIFIKKIILKMKKFSNRYKDYGQDNVL